MSSKHDARRMRRGPVVRKKPLSRSAACSLCPLPLLVLLLWVLAFSGLATAGGTATADQPARMSVQVPASAKSAGVVMLEVSIAVTRKPAAGHLGAVVRFRRPGGSTAEVGRVSIVGGEPELSVQRGALAVRPAAPPRSRSR